MKNELWRILAGLGAAFGVPWLLLIVLPYMRLASAEPIPYSEDDGMEVAAYPDPLYSRAGDGHGAKIYAREGCAYCHTQMVRPTYAGADMWRPGWGGNEEEGLARETRPADYAGEPFAYLGYQRIGPDLANVGSRLSDREWHHRHLFDPRSISHDAKISSVMPSFRHLYKVLSHGVSGSGGSNAIELKDGTVIVPTDEADALVNYLLSRKKDQKLPGS